MIIDNAWVVSVLLLSIRLGWIFFLSPITPITTLPVHLRLLIILTFSCLLVLSLSTLYQGEFGGALIIAGLSECLNGLILSLSIYAVFASFSLAGLLIDSQMGLNATSILNPQAKTHEPLMGYLLNLLAVAIFFATGCHRLLFESLSFSAKVLPLGMPIVTAGLKPALAQFSTLFVTGLMLASPVVFCLLIVDSSAGIITRNMPQISVYFVTLPLKVMLGFFLIFISLNWLNPVIEQSLKQIFANWQGVLQ